MLLSVQPRKAAAVPAESSDKEHTMFYSWPDIQAFLAEVPDDIYDQIVEHYLHGIVSAVSKQGQDGDLSEIVGPEVTGHQLLGLCFSRRLDTRPFSPSETQVFLGSCAAVAAAKGYVPAQAVAAQLLEFTDSVLRESLQERNKKWQRNAVATGYVLAWRLAEEQPEEHAFSLMKFREAGGYNTHYIYMGPEDKRAISYDDLGLLHQPLEWLSSYLVHQAAVFEDIPKLEALLGCGGYEIDSLDASGETPLQRACMAGAALSVHYLINNGANPTLKSKLLGTVPLHWLFVFEPQEIHDVAVLLTSGGKSVLHEVANSKARAFHFPFRWPVGTPLEWAVFSNRGVAVSVLLELGSGLEQINEFFPGPVENRRRETFRGCVYSTLVQYRLQVVRNHPAYKRQLGSKGNLWERDPSTIAVGNDPSATKQLDIATYIDYMLKGKTITRAAPLRDAIRQGNQGLVQLLLDSGARFDGLENPNEPAPLRLAT